MAAPVYSLTATAPGQAPVTKTFAAWGISTDFSGTLGSADQEGLELVMPGNAEADGFAAGTLIKITLNDRTFFNGVVPKTVRGRASGTERAISIPVVGYWHWFQDVFQATIKWQSGLVTPPTTPPTYNYTTRLTTHFTLNLDPDTFTIIGSRQQIKNVLDYLIAKLTAIYGFAVFDYDEEDIVDVPVLTCDAHNHTCAAIIRQQFENYQVIIGFDHGHNPPRFYARRADNCPAQTLTFATRPNANGVLPGGFTLERLDDQEVPFVELIFQKAVNGFNSYETQTWPASPNRNQFFPLIQTVPLRGFSSTTQSVNLVVEPIDLTNIEWWKEQIPKLADANEYADLTLLGGTAINLDYPALGNFISNDAAVPEWIDATIGKTRITAKFSHRRRVNGIGVYGSTVKTQTFEVRLLATDLAETGPDGYTFQNTTVNDWGENASDYSAGGKTMAQLIYEDLHPAGGKWAGNITVRERAFSGTITIGKKYNLANSKAAHATMNALAQQISFMVSSGFIEYEIRVGPNPALSVDTVAGRLRAARQNFATVRLTTRRGALEQPLIELPDVIAGQSPADSEPQHSQMVSVQQNSTNWDRSLVTTLPASGSTPDPAIITDRVNSNGVRQTAAGAMELRLSDLEGQNAKWRWTVMCWGGSYYKVKVARSAMVAITEAQANTIMSTSET